MVDQTDPTRFTQVRGIDPDGTVTEQEITASEIDNRVRLDVLGIEQDDADLLAGKCFCVSIEYVLNLNQTVYHSFLTPASQKVRLRLKTYSADRSEIQLWENPTVTAYAFNWTPRDRNRSTSNTAGSTVRAISTVSPLGTFLCKESNYGSGITQSQSPINGTQDWILDANTEYMFAMRSYAASNLTTLQIQWCEE